MQSRPSACPRLSLWEDAVNAGCDAKNALGFAKARVRLTGKGCDLPYKSGLRRPDERG